MANHPSSCNAADEGEGLSSKRGFRLQPEALEVKLPVDSDWAENATGRKSTWGEAVLFCGTLFSSCTRTQSVIAQFFKGAELVQYGEWSLEGAWHPECAR